MHAHLHRAAARRSVRRSIDGLHHTAPARTHDHASGAIHHLQQVSGNAATSRLLTTLRQPAAFDAPRAAFQNAPGASANTAQRKVVEGTFAGGGHVDPVRTSEHLVWNFDIGSSTLRAEHKAKLKEVAKEIVQALKTDKGAELDLEGQASSTGTDVRNEPLAKARAESVKAALVAEGVDSARIKSTSVGSAKSFEGATQEEFARSRAVRIILAPRLAPPPQPSQPVTPPVVKGCPPLNTKLLQSIDLTAGPVVKVNGEIRAGIPGGTPGMAYFLSPSFPPPTPSCAKFLLVQNAQPFFEIVYKDASRNRMEVSAFHVDGDPFPCFPGVASFNSSDSPGFTVGAKAEGIIRTIEIRHEFRIFYMMQPTGAPRFTLEAARWTWVAQARNPDPALGSGNVVLDGSISRVVPSTGEGKPTTELPVTSPDVTSAKFVTVPGAPRKQRSLADVHLAALNASRPPKKPGPTCT
jgi:outer membrane protein OmpA-like peptidoglycan-associated protein